MERMTKIDENIQTAQNMLSWIVERCYELEEENKKLKSDLAFERTMLDNVRAEYKSLQNVIKKLNEENEKLRIDREFEKWNTIFGM